MQIKSFLAIFFGVLTSACTAAGLAALNAPTAFSDYKVTHDIAYGPKEWQHLDIYVPPHRDDEKLDVVVFFYGGSWQSGSKDSYAFVAKTLAENRFITVIPDYAKYPPARFPEFVQDGAKAFAWVHDNITRFGGNVGRIHVMGHSAGAHTAVLLAADKRYLAAEGKQAKDVIRSIVGLAGPYDFTPEDPTLKKIFGPPANYSQMQVPTFIDGSEPPLLLLYGDKDKDVGRFNLDRLIAAIRSKNGCYHAITYPEADHVGMVVAFSWARKARTPVLQDTIRFLRGETPCDALSGSVNKG